jgi:tetratricopeptide (TPR) repeat protein
MRQTHVGVGNRSQFRFLMDSASSLHKIRFSGGYYSLADYIFIEATGEDTIRFFHGQMTSDIKSLEVGKGHYSSRLDRNGRIQYFFIVLRPSENTLKFCIHKDFSQKFLDEMDKFIIMDDVSLKVLEDTAVVATGLKQVEDHSGVESYQLPFYLESSRLLITSKNNAESLDKLEDLWFFSGILKNINVNFVNESVFNEFAISYSKGCYLGQETANKIQNNRGGAKYPILLKFRELKQDQVSSFKIEDQSFETKDIRGLVKFNGETFLSFLAPRHLRVKNLKVKVEIESMSYDAFVDYHPYFKTPDAISKAHEFYEYGVMTFQNDNFEEAEQYIRAAIKLDPKNAEYYESLGVLLGRVERYQEAIDLMDQLSEIDPETVMAHTNKSLYLMRLGRIEEAEEEKSKATIKSFSMFGKEAKEKKLLAENLEREKAELERKKQMFIQVLEIDPEDEIANFGLGDVSLREKKFSESLEFFERVLKTNAKHSQTYLKMGQALEAIGRKAEAKEIYIKGIDVASRQGELMPANQMQERLSLL